MNEEIINNRIQLMIDEFSQLPEMVNCNPPTFEVLNDKGDIKVTVFGITHDGRKKSAEKVFAFNDPLDSICDLFSYPEWIGRLSKDIASNSVRIAYFDEYGNLMVQHLDGSMEKFKIKEKHKEEIVNNLRNLLGDKLKIKS